MLISSHSFAENSLPAQGALSAFQRPEESGTACSRRGQHKLPLSMSPPAKMSETSSGRRRDSGKSLFRRHRSNVQRLLHVNGHVVVVLARGIDSTDDERDSVPDWAIFHHFKQAMTIFLPIFILKCAFWVTFL